MGVLGLFVTSTAGVTDVSGNFSIELPETGEYSIHAERQGFFVYNGSWTQLVPGASQLTITLTPRSL